MKRIKSLLLTICVALATPAFAANPAPGWVLKSETVVTSPKDRTRLKVGVGEKVKITAPCPASWAITGGGSLNPVAPAKDKTTVTFAAPETGATVTITATLSVDGSSKDIVFEVVEPSGVFFEKITDTVTQNTPVLRAQFTAKVYLTPADVNFEAVSSGESKVAAVTTEYFNLRYPNGLQHAENGPIPSISHVENKGTLSAGNDTIGTGENGPLGNPASYSKGTFTWSIPQYYELGATKKEFTTVDHVQEMSIDANNKATLSLSKAGLSHSVTQP